MDKYIIEGKKRLIGDVDIGGAKNAVLPIIASTVLNKGISYLTNVPMLLDTLVALDILREIGCIVHISGNSVSIDSKNVYKTDVPNHLVEKMRSSIIFLGSILSRFKEASIGYPGGCNLGKRPIDFHLLALKNMGAIIKETDKKISISLNKAKSCKIKLPFPSVGATQNIMLASVLSSGNTITISNCAKEPEIEDMALFLNKMGANIKGAGTGSITIYGVSSLRKYVEHNIMPDRIEAGTFLCMSALNNGDVLVKNAIKKHIKPTLDALSYIGCDITFKENNIRLKAPKCINHIPILETNPHPSFPTDMQPQIMSVLVAANGKSIIKENIFEARNKHIGELIKMGAIIKQKNSTFTITGTKNILANDVYAMDLRGGACLINMALFADGISNVYGASFIKRGYENIEKKLQKLGANIKYIKD